MAIDLVPKLRKKLHELHFLSNDQWDIVVINTGTESVYDCVHCLIMCKHFVDNDT